MTPRRRRTWGILACGVLLSAQGCAAVEVAPAPGADSQGCIDVATSWPTAIDGHEEVTTRPDGPGVAAWGDPAIIARCGVAPPGPTTLECIAVDSVDWIVQPLSDGMAFTTFGRDPAMEVIVPSDYAPEPLMLGSFTAAANALPRTSLRCR